MNGAGLAHERTLMENDYRESHGSFDKLESRGMVETAGWKNLSMVFEKWGGLVMEKGTMLRPSMGIGDRRCCFAKAFPAHREHGLDEGFRRVWGHAFRSCEGGSQESAISGICRVAGRPGNREGMVRP
jgi:hypothetical protein